MQRLAGLDLMRAIAVLSVTLYHAWRGGFVLSGEAMARFGWMGVDLFFVLSGFLIGSQLLQAVRSTGSVSFGQFYTKRCFRILPAFLVMTLIYFCFAGAREYPEIQPIWHFLTFTQNLLINSQEPRTFSHAWSLCVEEHFYLLVPVLIWFLARRVRAKDFVLLTASLMAAGMAWRWYIWCHHLESIKSIASGPGNFLQIYLERIYYVTHTRLDGLLTGVALAVVRVYRPHLWRGLLQRGNTLLLAGVIGVMLSVWLFWDRFAFLPAVLGYPVLSLSLACLVAAAASAKSFIGARALPGTKFLATTSYSIYLSHKMAFHLTRQAWGAHLDPHSAVAHLVYAAAALLTGSVLYWLIERPGLTCRAWLLRRQQPALTSHPDVEEFIQLKSA